MKRNLLISAVMVIGLVGGSSACADLILTIDGENPTGVPLMLEGIGPYVIALDGNTPFEPNDIKIEAVGGTLSAIPDVNYQYYLQYEAESTAGFVRIIANTDMTIDGIFAPADTTIYELFIFCNTEFEFTGACGSDLSFFFPPEEEQGEGDSMTEIPSEEPSQTIEESPIETQSQTIPDTNYLQPIAIRQERQIFQKNCSNGIEHIPYSRIRNNKSETLVGAGEGSGQLLLDGTIEINSDITTNQIWTANNTYWITTDISVQALLVIEPGTIIQFAYDTAMYIENGGTLISSGTPDNLIIYTCDFLYPDWGTYWQYIYDYDNYYFCPIYIEHTASPATTVTYNFIEGAYLGIVSNNIKLDHPIENNYLMGNMTGIGELGTKHTDIINNVCYASYFAGIDVHLADEFEVADPGSVIHITNNTCDTATWDGIVIHGVENIEDMGLVVLTNNIVTYNYCGGIHLTGGWISWLISNTGYYGNTEDTENFEESQQYDPVYATENPYVEGSELNTLLALKPDCNFINTGDDYIENTPLIGKTTDANAIPDVNYVDLGFHYIDWNYSNAGDGNSLAMDLYADSFVDFKDFAVLASGWQITYNINDLNTMADEWLKTGIGNPPIAVTISGDPNNLSGEVSIGINGRPPETTQGFIYIDGELRGEIDYRLDPETTSEYVTLDTMTLKNGEHDIKAVTIDCNGLITVSPKISVDTNNIIYSLVKENEFSQDKDYRLYAMGNYSNDLRAKLYDWNGNLVWTSETLSGNIILNIPAGIFTDEIYDISVEAKNDTNNWEEIWNEAIGKKYDENGDYKVQIYLPNGSGAKSRKKAVAKIVERSRAKGFTCAVWYKRAANWATFSYQIPKTGTEIVYIVTHGGDHIKSNGQTVNRRCFLLSAPEGSGNEYVFSKRGGLPGNMDNDPSVHSIRELDLGSRGTLRIVYVTACFNANLNEEDSEMGKEWLKNGIDSIGQVYISFIGLVTIGDRYHQDWDFEVWNKWFAPEQNSWADVLDYCYIHCDQGSKIWSETGTCGDSSTRID